MSARSARNNASGEQGVKRPASKRWPWRSLTWQILFLTILPLTILVLVIALGSLSVHQNAMRALVSERDERAVQMAATALEEELSHRKLAIRNLALLAERAKPAQLTSLLTNASHLLTEFDIGLAFFGPNGVLEDATGSSSAWLGWANSGQLPIKDLLLQGNSSDYLTSAYVHPQDGEAVILVFAVSQTRDWVAAGAFSAAAMMRHTLTDAFTSGSQASVIVLDGDRRLLYQSGSFGFTGELSDHPGVAEALRGESGTQYVMVDTNADHPPEEHVVAYSPVAPLGWALVLEEPWEMVATPTLRTSQMAPLVLVPVLLLAVVAIWFAARRVIKPLQTLESKAALLSWGDFKAIEEPVGGIEEIRQLQAELIHMARKVQTAQSSLHGYIGAITAAQEDERRRLARELHDDTIQALIALKQRIHLVKFNTGHNRLETGALHEIAILIEQTIENLRRLTRALRPIYLEDLGLVTALEMLVQETRQTLNIPVEFQHEGEERLLPAVELAFYRIAQEALSNIARHAEASHVAMKISFLPGKVILQVIDNGKGFNIPKSPAEFAPNGHYGLLGMYERAELMGARLEIASAAGEGTHVTVSFDHHTNV